MFGYVKPNVPELKMRENQYYRAAYCGLCHAMQREMGFLSRMTLSYDITFLLLLRLAVSGERPDFERKRCFAHPAKKRLTMLDNASLRYCANVGVLLARHKMSDDVSDEKILKKMCSAFLRLMISPAYKRAERAYAELNSEILAKLEELHRLEREGLRSADRPARIFGELMASVASYGLADEGKRRIASSVGMQMGRWVYLIDALDDMEEDRKNGCYNPFLLLFDGAELDGEKKKDIEAALLGISKKAAEALDLADLEGRRDLCGLLYNIISEGIPSCSERVLFGENEKDNFLKTESENERSI